MQLGSPLQANWAAIAARPFCVPNTLYPAAFPPFDSAASFDVRPVAEFRHVQRHRHELHVWGTLPAWPACPQFAVESFRARSLRRCRLCAALPSLPASYALLSARQYLGALNQPLDFNTYSVTTMHAMFYVRSARSLPPISLYLRRS